MPVQREHLTHQIADLFAAALMKETQESFDFRTLRDGLHITPDKIAESFVAGFSAFSNSVTSRPLTRIFGFGRPLNMSIVTLIATDSSPNRIECRFLLVGYLAPASSQASNDVSPP